jgi:hypothetical protein
MKGKYVRLTKEIPSEPNMLVGDVFWRKMVGVDTRQAHGWVFDLWVCAEDGHEYRIPDTYRDHFEVVKDTE